MALSDLDCVVCFYQYSRSERIPRVLHCGHTFCAPCLERLAKTSDSVCTVCCPVCRWITCVRAILTVQGALWVNTEIWDQISEDQLREDDESTTSARVPEPPITRKSTSKPGSNKLLDCCMQVKRS